MNNYSDQQQLPINFNNFNQQFQNDDSLHSPHNTSSSASSSFNITPDKQPTNTIKERLNLHVKRKILENSSITAAGIGNCTVTSQQYQQQQQQLNKQRINNIITAIKTPNINSSGGTDHSNSTTTDSAIIPKRKKRSKKNEMLSVASISRSVSRTGGSGGIGDDSHDDNLSCHDTNSNSTAITGNTILTSTTTPITNSKNSKDNKKEPDILAQILNQKKLALMRDPEIIELLNIMTKKLENNQSNHNQS